MSHHTCEHEPKLPSLCERILPTAQVGSTRSLVKTVTKTQTEMEVDDDEGNTPASKEAIALPRKCIKMITSSSVGSVTTLAQSRVIQSVPASSAASSGRPPKLQIVKLVAPGQQQQMLKIQGAPVRVVTAGAPPTRIQIAPSSAAPATVSVQAASTATANTQPVKVVTSQRLILPANSKPSTPQIVTIPVSHNSGRMQTVLSSGSTVFSPATPGGQVVAFLSPQKAASSANRPVQVIGQTTPSSTGRTYVQIATAPETSRAQPSPAKRESDMLSVKKELAADSGQRKPCNCTKSHCLKLYCDCFAKGEFCHNCNCVGCANILSKEEQRQKAIKQCLLRNPHAFHPKIGKGESAEVRRHQKGCNCKRSGCLKNYCECFEARILCGTMCKCVGCKNCEENSESVSLLRMADAAMVKTMQVKSTDRISQAKPGLASPSAANKMRDSLQDHLTAGVIEGVLDCLLVQCHEAEAAKCKADTTEKLLLEEFGRCLTRIIQSSATKS